MTTFPSYNPNDRTKYRVNVTKRKTGEQFSGTATNDGLQSLFTVHADDGTTRYASVLDDIEWLEAMPNA